MTKMKGRFHWAGATLGMAVLALALVACGGGAASDTPTTVVTAARTADTVSASDEGDRPQGPPDEALQACAALAADTSCSFTSPRDGSAVDGTCRTRRNDPSQLVCFPDDWDGRGPGQGRGGPPEEALAACNEIDTGAVCTFESRIGTVEGTCVEGREGQAVCRPDWADGEGPYGPGDGRRARGIAACDGQSPDAACSFEGRSGVVDGTCRTGRDGSTLVCAPER